MANEQNTNSDPAQQPPTDQREYILWRALQHAPYPIYRGREAQGSYGHPMGWREIDWLREYEMWHSTWRTNAMKEVYPGALMQQMVRLQQENDRLRTTLIAARDGLDQTRLMQQIDEVLGSLLNDVDSFPE